MASVSFVLGRPTVRLRKNARSETNGARDCETRRDKHRSEAYKTFFSGHRFINLELCEALSALVWKCT